MRDHDSESAADTVSPPKALGQRATGLAGALASASASGRIDARAAARALKAGNRAVGRLLAREHRRYHDAPLPSHAPSMSAADVDRQLERLRTTGRGQGANAVRLGTIDRSTASADEQARVNYLIWQYMEFGRVENAQIDAVIEIPGAIDLNNPDPLAPLPPPTRILWTLTFTTANNVTDVSADRIGPPDAALSIAGVRGFPGFGATTAELSAWVQRRYPALATVPVPAVAPQQVGTTAPTEAAIATASAQSTFQYVAALDAARRTQARTPAWFQTNYGIEILTAAAADTRMSSAHSWAQGRRADMRDWEPERLETLESALETIDTAFLTALRGIKMGRQRVRLVSDGASGFNESPATYGETLRNGSEVTILIYNSHGDQDDRRFVGSRNRGVRRASVMQLLHELGHAVSYRTSGLETAFRTRFQGTASPTQYGRSGVTEEFPEAFALYHADRDYLHDEWRPVFDWFNQASSTGTAPPAPPPAAPARR